MSYRDEAPRRGPNIGLLLGTIAIIVVVVGLIAWIGFYRQVDQGETCVVVKLGRVTGYAPVGGSWRLRGMFKYACYPSRGIMYQTATNAEGDADFVDWPINANTSDGQKVEVTANVVFHIDPEQVEQVYSNVGKNIKEVKTRVVANYTRSFIRNIVPSYEALDLYTHGRVAMELEVRQALLEQFKEYGVTLDEFSLRSITFDVDYAQVLENKQVALENVRVKEYEAEQAVYEAQRAAALAKGEADAAIERARGAAESQVIAAKADAEAQVLIAEGEAKAIELRGEALKRFPEVLQLNFIKALETIKWLMLPSEGITPFLPLDVLGQ